MEFHKSLSSASYFRNFIFGVEDSLVSTVGLLSGVAIAGVPRETVFLTGVVLILVEAFSMAAGSFLSEFSAEGFARQAEQPSRSNFIFGSTSSRRAGLIMFISYFISGFIPLSPYLFLPVSSAIWISVTFSVVALFILGVVGAKISGIKILKNGFRMAIVGGIAISVGMLAGNLLS